MQPHHRDCAAFDAEYLESFAPLVDMEIDKGIRRYVLIMRAGGIDTFESCQGGPGHACPDPMIRFYGNNGEGFKALAIAMTYHLPVLSVALVWDFNDYFPHGPWWTMTFRSADPIAEQNDAAEAERHASAAPRRPDPEVPVRRA